MGSARGRRGLTLRRGCAIVTFMAEQVSGQGEPSGGDTRPTLDGLSVDWLDESVGEVAVEVGLSWHGHWAAGTFEGVAVEEEAIDAAARATLLALEELVPSVRFELQWIGVVDAPTDEVIRIVTTLVQADEGADRQWLYTGSSIVRGDLRVAAVRATLDGINRPLQFLGQD
jgi:hypothetical protein